MIRKILLISVSLGLFLASGVWFASCTYFQSGSYEGPKSEHFDGSAFFNENPRPMKSFFKYYRMRLKEEYAKWPEWVTSEYQEVELPRTQPRELHITFINHATTLIQLDGINILTDPIWSKRCSPFTFVGPKRVRNPGIRIEDLPKIDYILISHDHYDHMDIATLKKLSKRDAPKIYTGLGNASFLTTKDIANVYELDWWQEEALSDHFKIIFAQVQHFSGRGPWKRNQTLWGGYILQGMKHQIYFAGDTGYADHFKEAYKRYGQNGRSINSHRRL